MKLPVGFRLGLVLVVFCQLIQAYDPSLNWKTLTTQHFFIHFDSSNQALAEKTAVMAEKIHQKLSRELNWIPAQPTHLVLTDHTDLANGYATPQPYNRSVLFIHPPIAGQLDFGLWLESLITHEYTHILHLDKAFGIAKGARSILGRFPMTFPNSFQPSWLIEGYATFKETDFVSRIGRGQSTLFKLMMREELKHGFKPISEVNMASHSWPLNARYLYGYFFFQFLTDTYGKKTVDQFIDNYSDNWFPYLINSNAESVLGKDLNQLWQDFENYLRESLLSESEQVKNITTSQFITSDGFFKYDLELDERGNLWVTQNDGVHRATLNKITAQGEIHPMIEIHSQATFDRLDSGDILLAQPEICDEFYTYYDLYLWHSTTSQLTRLTQCSRYFEAQWDKSQSSIIAIKADGGRYQLDRLTAEGQWLETLWQGDDATVVSQLDINSDGNYLVATVLRSGSSRANIELFDITKRQWTKIHPSINHQWYPRFSKDGQSITFSGEVDNSFQLFEYDLNRGGISQLTWSDNAIFQHVIDRGQNKGIGIAYTHVGYQVMEFNLAQSEQRQSEIPLSNPLDRRSDSLAKFSSETESALSSDSISNPNQDFRITDYSPWSTLWPKWWFPFAVGSDTTVEVGAQTSGQDALENHFYLAAASVELERKLPNLFLHYQYHHSIDFQLQFYHDVSEGNAASSSDLVIQNTDLEVGYHIPKHSMLDAWDVEFALSFETERYYLWQQNNLNFVREFRDAYTGLALTYDSAKQFARSISENDGRSVRAVLATSDVLESDFSGNSALLDWREYIQIDDEQALALRMIAGSGDNQAQPFRVGGHFSDYFFFRAPTLLERRYALRGYPDNSNELTGRHLRYLSSEWRFPIAHIERTWMSPPLGVEKISGRVFYDQARIYGHTSPLVADRKDQLADRIYRSSGAELMVQLRLFYYLPFDLRIGYANGHDKTLGDDEVYVQFGTSF
jgi:hypothetical protein